MKNLAKDLKEKSFKYFYLIHGDENYLLSSYKKEFIKSFNDSGEMNTKIIDAENYDESDLIDWLYKMPFFADKKLLIIESILIDNEKIFDVMQNCKENNVILFVFPVKVYKEKIEKIDKRSKLYKFVAENGYICEFTTQSDEMIQKLIKNKITKNKKVIETRDAAYLITKTGKNLNNIMTELEKLIAYVGDRENITRDDIDKVVHSLLEDKVFDMIKYINNKNMQKAYEIYADLTLADTSSGQELKGSIIGLMRYNYNLILSIKSLKARGLNKKEIMQMMGLKSEYQITSVSDIEKSHDENYFIKKILKLYEYNKKLRTDNIDKKAIIEMLMN